MLQTKEQIKKAIVDYLGLLPKKTTQVEEYTLSTISEKVKADSSKVEVAITELKNEGLIDIQKVQLEICLPRNQDGSQILATFANKKYITFSPYWAIIYGFALLFGAILALGDRVPGFTTLYDAYVVGFRYGCLATFLACFVGGMVIQGALTRFRCWKILSEKIYKLVTNLVKHSVYIFVPLFIVYYALLSYFGQPIEATVVVALLALSVGTSLGFEQLRRSKL
jgi:hypothetical protein